MDLLKLDTKDFEELFFDMSPLKNIFERKERFFQTDFNFPKSKLGTYELTTQKQGKSYVTQTKSYFHQNILAKSNEGIDNIALYFIKGGAMCDYSFENEYRLTPHSYNVLFMNEEYKGKGFYAKEYEQKATSLHLPIPYFEDLAKQYPELFEKYFLRYQKGESFYLNSGYRDIPAQLCTALTQLENSCLIGSCDALYADAKVLEILSMIFQTPNDKETSLCYCKTSRDSDKIQEAAFILLSDIYNPPTLKKLALSVGVNEKKLKYGFKEIYGTTAYGYLFDYKMVLAQQLLLDTDKNITEVALACGYDYPSHFCTAFKRKFGVTPSQFRKSK